VLAKTARDALMRELDGEYPGYGFARYKGYGTPQHRAALAQWGMCSIHRKSFNIKHDQNLPQGSDPSLRSGQALREVDFRLAWMLLGRLTPWVSRPLRGLGCQRSGRRDPVKVKARTAMRVNTVESFAFMVNFLFDR